MRSAARPPGDQAGPAVPEPSSGRSLFPVHGVWQLVPALGIPLLLTAALAMPSEPVQYRPSAIYVAGLVVVAALAGRRATIVASIVSLLGLWFVVLPPAFSFALDDVSDVWGLIAFAICAASLLWMVTRLEWTGSRLIDAERDEAAAERRELAAELRARELQAAADGRFRSLVEATTSLVWFADAGGAFVERQVAWETSTGQPWPDQAGSGWHAMIHAGDRPSFVAGWARAVATGATCERRLRLWHRPTQMWRWFELRAVAIRDHGGAVVEWIGSLADVHAEVEALLVADRARAELQSTLAERDRVARTLQASLLPPELPRVPGLRLAARYLAAASGGGIGGDFYDVYPSGEGDWDIVMGDVCGKGADAAALTALARHSLRAAAIEHEDPAQILSLLNEAIIRADTDGRFATVAYGKIDASRERLSVALAGHHQPRLVRDGAVQRVGVHGPPVGVLPRVSFELSEVALRPGDQLVWFTDGLIDQPADRFAEDDLDPFLAASVSSSPDGPDALADALVARAGTDDERADDVAILVVAVEHASAAGTSAAASRGLL